MNRDRIKTQTIHERRKNICLKIPPANDLQSFVNSGMDSTIYNQKYEENERKKKTIF